MIRLSCTITTSSTCASYDFLHQRDTLLVGPILRLRVGSLGRGPRAVAQTPFVRVRTTNSDKGGLGRGPSSKIAL